MFHYKHSLITFFKLNINILFIAGENMTVNMWMVRAGEKSFLLEDFKDLNVVSIGWEIGDLTGKNPSEIKKMMKQFYPDISNQSLGVNAAQVSKFVCDIQIGDYVLTHDSLNKEYLVGIITSNYYCSDLLYNKYGESETFYHHFRDVKWIGVTKKDDLNEQTFNLLKQAKTVFKFNNSSKSDVLFKMNNDKFEWIDFYTEFAHKLLEFKDNRSLLIEKIQNIFSNLNIELPKLESDNEGNSILPYDIDPFTVFGFFNKGHSLENRINFVNQFKEEFSINADAPYTFHGIAVLNNQSATFYGFGNDRRYASRCLD